jgi:putative hydrolase of the HAD superfamily
VGFDLDDTLLDHSVAVGRGLTDMVQASDWPQLPDDIVQWRDLEKRHYPRYVRGELSFLGQRRERLAGFLAARGIAPESVDLDATFAEYIRHYERHWAAVPGVQELLGQQRALGRAIGILTNGPRAIQLTKIDRIGIAPLVDIVVAIDDLPEGKPEASAFVALCERLGTSASEAVYVGDDLDIDARGARAAGLRGVWFRRPNTVGFSTEHDHDVLVADSIDQLRVLLTSDLG